MLAAFEFNPKLLYGDADKALDKISILDITGLLCLQMGISWAVYCRHPARAEYHLQLYIYLQLFYIIQESIHYLGKCVYNPDLI